MEYNSERGRVRLNPNGPDSSAADADGRSGFAIIGPNIEGNSEGLGDIAAVVATTAVVDGPEPGPADLAAVLCTIYKLWNMANAADKLSPMSLPKPQTLLNDGEVIDPEPIAGDFTDSIGKIAAAIGHTKKEVKQAIHKIKTNLKGGGPIRNPDVEVDLNTGEVYPKLPGGGRGDSIGNIGEFLPSN